MNREYIEAADLSAGPSMISVSNSLARAKALEKMFIVAAIARDKDQVTDCLERGVNPNVFFSNSRTTALHCFAERGDVSLAIRLLMHKEVKLNIPDAESYTPLHLASIFGKVKMVYLLAKHGADLNGPTRIGRTALMLACRSNHFDVVKTLLDFHVLVNITDYFGCSPLSIAANDIKNEKMVRLLLRHAADTTIKIRGILPLFFELILHCISFTQLRIIQIFLDQEEYNVTELIDVATGKNCLHYAALAGYIPLVVLLLEKTHSEKIVDEDISGRTPMDVAKKTGNVELIKLFESHAPLGPVQHSIFASRLLLFDVPMRSISEDQEDDEDNNEANIAYVGSYLG